jgi:hypothetical protein
MELAKKLFSVVSKTIRTINDNVTRRERKTNLIDAFAFELLYVDGNTSREQAAAKVNAFRKDKSLHVSREALEKRTKQLTVNHLNHILFEVNEFTKTLQPMVKNDYIVRYAVDGSYINLNKALLEDGFLPTMNKQMATAQVMGIPPLALGGRRGTLLIKFQ